MIIVFGLVLLVAAVIVGVAAVLGNAGAAHTLAHPFSVLGYHLTGSTGTLFLSGIVVGALGLLGLTVLLGGARRTSRRGREARQGLRRSRRETAAVSQHRDELLDQREAARADTATVSQHRDELLDQREAARADTASATGNSSRNGSPLPGQDSGSGRSWQRLFRPPAAHSPEAASPPAAAPAPPADLLMTGETADPRAEAAAGT